MDHSEGAAQFSLRERPLFAFAGLYRQLDDETGTYGFLTCEANPLVGAVHPKATPVILHAEDHDRWLDGSMEDVRELATPFPSQLMKVGQAPLTCGLANHMR
ncbi:MAG TPA: SOS response-associated peptidase family protein [Sphingomonadaceae bacterium]|nr:SOS response-associated peptidase family protein [Sphingomonadaceae bacterium]